VPEDAMSEELFPTEPEARQRIVSCRPISFTSESIHGIEKGLKSQTRRVIYPQPEGAIEPHPEKVGRWRRVQEADHLADEDLSPGTPPDGPLWKCPYGVPGDRLWTREIWARVEPYSTPRTKTCPQGPRQNPDVLEKYDLPITWRVEKDPALLEFWRKRVIYLADFPGKEPEECGRGASDNKWRSPVTMPRWASRHLLEVIQVRAERVQEISEEDAIAEGVNAPLDYYAKQFFSDHWYRDGYKRLWDAINGRKNPWAANPWVWPITFSRLP
jgi:hypothetical protein